MVRALRDASWREVPVVAQTLLGATKRHPQLDEIGAAAVRQLDALEVVPNALGWVELGGVTGQLLQVQAPGRALAQEVLDWLPRWIGAPSQMTSSLPAILRSSTRRKRTTSGEW